jgi:hypothetical protein
MIKSYKYCLILVSVSGLYLPAGAYADSWDVTQTVDTKGHINLTQSNGTASIQAINAVNLGDASTVKAIQGVNTNGNDISLVQSGKGNKQAANYIKAKRIENSSQTVSARNANLTSSGNNNIQALNLAIAQETNGLTQTVNLTGAATFTLNNATNTKQAGNYLDTDTVVGDIQQSFTLPSNISYSDTNGSNNVQAGNLLIRSNTGSVNGTISQNYSANSVTVTTSTNTTQTANYIGLKN